GLQQRGRERPPLPRARARQLRRRPPAARPAPPDVPIPGRRRLARGRGADPAARGAAGFRFFFQAEDGIRDYKVTGVQTWCSSDLNLDEALRILKNAVRKREPASVGVIGNAAEIVPELAHRGVLPNFLTDQTPADDPLAYIPQGLTTAQSDELRERDPSAYRERALDSIATQVRAMLEIREMGAVVFEFGNGMRAQAFARGVSDAYKIPDFVSEYLLPDLEQGRGLLTVVGLSG